MGCSLSLGRKAGTTGVVSSTTLASLGISLLFSVERANETLEDFLRHVVV